jgi:hypothetical protein
MHEIYVLHGLIADPSGSDHAKKIVAILAAYISGGFTLGIFGSRTYRHQIQAILARANHPTAGLDIETLLNELKTLYEVENGFTPNGDLDHALAAIYQCLPPSFKDKIGHLQVTLADNQKRTLHSRYPVPAVEIGASHLVDTSSPLAARAQQRGK